MKSIFLLSCLILSSSIQSAEHSSVSQEQNVKTLTHVGENYLALLDRIGADQNLSHAEAVAAICAPNCKKIVNGAVWFEGRQHFLPQLLATGKNIGFWKVEPLAIIPSSDGRTVVVHFLVPTDKIGTWDTLVILRCNDDLLITEIDEVFNAHDG